MKLTIAFDDISLPLPPMKRPDIRQRVIEQVLDLAAAAGVDDVELIAALALHRRMTESELRHAVGDRVYDSFAPTACSTTTTPRIPTTSRSSGTTEQGEEVEINKRAAESDLARLRQHQHRRRWTAAGRAPPPAWPATAASATTTTCKTMQQSRSFMDRHHSELHSSNWRMGKVLRDAGVKVFQIETTINNNVFGTDGPMSVLQKREWEWSGRDRVTFLGMKAGLDRLNQRQRRGDLPVVAGARTSSPRCRPARSRPSTR